MASFLTPNYTFEERRWYIPILYQSGVFLCIQGFKPTSVGARYRNGVTVGDDVFFRLDFLSQCCTAADDVLY